jgi:hypothetical protein
MGKKVGKLRQFEYIRGENPTESVIAENKLSATELENERTYMTELAQSESTFVPSDGVPITSERLAKQGEAVIEDMVLVDQSLDFMIENPASYSGKLISQIKCK